MGSPSAWPSGTDIAGSPAKLASGVKGTNSKTRSTAASMPPPSFRSNDDEVAAAMAWTRFSSPFGSSSPMRGGGARAWG